MTMKTLWCEAGQHEWERPAQRGRVPHNCPEHLEDKTERGMNGLEKARIVRAEKKSQKEEEIATKVNEILNDPRMKASGNSISYANPLRETASKLSYIQNQLTNRKDRPPHELADLERMREKILKDPFNHTGHLF